MSESISKKSISKNGKKITRYKENPFIEDMVVPMKDKKVQLSRLGRDSTILINQATGEIQGTHITTYKRVDGEQFVKLFTANIALTFNLTSAGIKALNVLTWAVQHKALSKDEVDLDALVLSDFIEEQLKQNSDVNLRLSLATFKRGINELEDAQIIAKALRQGRYFINPNFMFNGDRIAFTTVIERKKKTTHEKLEEAGQKNWITEQEQKQSVVQENKNDSC